MDNYISIGVGKSMCGAARTSIISVKGYHYVHQRTTIISKTHVYGLYIMHAFKER